MKKNIIAVKINGKSAFSLIFIIVALTVFSAAATVTTYPAPLGEVLSTDYSVTADGKKVDVYKALGQAQYGGDYSFCNFDFSGSVSIVITTSQDLSNLAICPKSFGIVPTVSGNTVTINLSQPRYFSVEPNGRTAPLLIFANPPEANPPKQGDPGVVYYSPGIYSPTDNNINLSSNQTLYLAGGSIIKGAVYCNGDNIKICGRGLIDGNQWGHFERSGFVINFDNRRNIRIEGITVRGSWAGTVWPEVTILLLLKM